MKLSELKSIIREKLCKKGEAYRKKRMAAGEKSSAYLSGRAVKVCKGQMAGENIDPKSQKQHKGKSAPYGSAYSKLEELVDESLRDWFKKEDWVRIDTQGNISGKCGTMKKGKATTRCLPRAKANSMSKAERKASVAKKIRGGKKGKQFVSVKEQDVFYDTEIVREEDNKEFAKYLREICTPENVTEAKYKGRTVTLNKPMRGDVKKFKVYVNSGKKNADGSIKVKKVNFGHGGTSAKRPTMSIRKSNPKRRKAFRARHRCATPGPKTMARYWSCKAW